MCGNNISQSLTGHCCNVCSTSHRRMFFSRSMIQVTVSRLASTWARLHQPKIKVHSALVHLALSLIDWCQHYLWNGLSYLTWFKCWLPMKFPSFDNIMLFEVWILWTLVSQFLNYFIFLPSILACIITYLFLGSLSCWLWLCPSKLLSIGHINIAVYLLYSMYKVITLFVFFLYFFIHALLWLALKAANLLHVFNSFHLFFPVNEIALKVLFVYIQKK